MQYDELIKQLRNRRMCIQGLGTLNDYPLLGEAADAIEELLSERDEVNADSWKTAFEVERDEHHWISVKERLPEASGHYLICLECKCDGESFSSWMQVAWFRKKFYWEHQYGDGICTETVTHWMPLPSTEGLSET